MKNTRHGMSNTRIYREWAGMKARCYCKSHNKFPKYGGAGIVVCDEWKEFLPFYEWALKHGYSDGLTLDRINGNGNYEPDNCRWASYKVQNNNRNINVYVEINGEKKTVTEWSEVYNISPITVFSRIKNGWSPIDAITKKKMSDRTPILIEIDGEVKNVSQWSRIYGISKDIVYYRINKRNWNPVDAVTTPVRKGR